MYNFYHEAQEAGLDVTKFSLYEYGDHPNEERPFAKDFKDYEDIEWFNNKTGILDLNFITTYLSRNLFSMCFKIIYITWCDVNY